MSTFFDRLLAKKLWASAGSVTEPTDSQADDGWKYVSNGIPREDQFNGRDRQQDQADLWNFSQIAGAVRAAGLQPQEAGDNWLADALRMFLSNRPVLFLTAGSGTYVPDNKTRLVAVAVTGGGGGSGGCNSTLRGGAGGGAGGTAIGWYSVTPGAAISLIVGAGGFGGSIMGQPGGSSSFGTFCSASGGSGGGRIDPANLDGGLGGMGVNGLINLRGGDGIDGHLVQQRIGTGVGGAAFLGSNRRPGSSSQGAAGANPGDGAAGPYYNGSSLSGGSGANGRVIVWPVA